MSAAPGSSAGIGHPVTLTAGASGCPNANPVYRFSMLAPGATSYTLVQDYSATPTFAWSTAGIAPGTYRFSVWARDASSAGAYGNTSGRWDVYNNNVVYTLTTCTALNVNTSPASPKTPGTTVTLTAGASGCPNPAPVYHFALLAPGATSYTVVQDYSAGATFTWNTTGLAPGTYRFSVWARDASSSGAYSNSSGAWDVYNNYLTFTLS